MDKAKIYAEGKINYSIEKVWQLWGLEWGVMNEWEKKIIMNLILYTIKMDVCEKG